MFTMLRIKFRTIYARLYILYKHAELALSGNITSVHVKLTAVVSLLMATLISIMVWFKWTEIHFENAKWSDILVLYIFIPFLWFGLWCAWMSNDKPPPQEG